MDNYTVKHELLIINNVYYYPRKELSRNTPNKLIKLLYGLELLSKLEISKVDRSRVNLTPCLLIK